MKHAVVKKKAGGSQSYWARLKRDLIKNKAAYVLFLPVLLYYLIFCYKPMYGLIIAFKDFTPYKGILGSAWAGNFGMEHFIRDRKSVV